MTLEGKHMGTAGVHYLIFFEFMDHILETQPQWPKRTTTTKWPNGQQHIGKKGLSWHSFSNTSWLAMTLVVKHTGARGVHYLIFFRFMDHILETRPQCPKRTTTSKRTNGRQCIGKKGLFGIASQMHHRWEWLVVKHTDARGVHLSLF